MPNNQVPVHSINVPNGGVQRPVTIPQDAPVYSSYTGNFIGRGPQPFGVRCDAPLGHPNYGQNFHVIVHNPANQSWMEHGLHYTRK